MFSSRTKSLTLLLFSLLIVLDVNAKLIVRKPEDLAKKIDTAKGIDYAVITPQNKITYKKMFIGNLLLASPDDACTPIPPIISSGDKAISNPVVIANWGECHYAQKVQNAEIAGAKMLLLVLQHDMATNHPSVRQLPLDTSIEVIAVSKTDGETLMRYLKAQNERENRKDSVVEIKYTFEAERHVNYQSGDKVRVDFWFVASDETKQSYDFFEDLELLLSRFGNKVQFNPHYVLWRNEYLEDQNYNEDDERCLAGGRYCDPQPENAQKLFGAEGVLESLRQICWKSLNDKVTVGDDWWTYTKAFGRDCVDKDMPEIKNCRNSLYDMEGISREKVVKVENCMKTSFGVSDNRDLTKVRYSNNYLEDELKLREEMQVDYYPSLYANGEKYLGSFRNMLNLQEFLCSHIDQGDLPSVCTELQVLIDPAHTASDTMFYIFIIVISVLVMAVMLYCVRRTVKRQIMGRMNDEITQIVTQYKQFKDKSHTADDDL